jgi:hypothetical protein
MKGRALNLLGSNSRADWIKIENPEKKSLSLEAGRGSLGIACSSRLLADEETEDHNQPGLPNLF